MKHDIRAKSVSPLSRGAPLVPQNALFRRVKLETEDEMSLNYNESEGSRRKGTTPQTTRFHSASFEDGDARDRELERSAAATETFRANKVCVGSVNGSILPANALQANTSTPLPNLTESVPEAEAAAKARSELLISMFRDVAM